MVQTCDFSFALDWRLKNLPPEFLYQCLNLSLRVLQSLLNEKNNKDSNEKWTQKCWILQILL